MADIFDELRIYCEINIRHGSIKPTIKISEGKGVGATIKMGDTEINLKTGDLSKRKNLTKPSK